MLQIRDTQLHEHGHRYRGNGAGALATLRTGALNLLRLSGIQLIRAGRQAANRYEHFESALGWWEMRMQRLPSSGAAGRLVKPRMLTALVLVYHHVIGLGALSLRSWEKKIPPPLLGIYSPKPHHCSTARAWQR